MDYFNLSDRLEAVAQFVPEGAKLADIGSDHAYLPIVLMKRGQICTAICGEIAQGPLESSRRAVKDANLEDSISVRFGDGLEVIQVEDSITVISIAGMGGSLIRDILERGKHLNKLANKPKLILQANNHVEALRSWLGSNSYQIVDELLIHENNKYYVILAAEYKADLSVDLSWKAHYFGDFLSQKQPQLFQMYLKSELKRIEKILVSLSLAQDEAVKTSEFQRKHQQIQDKLQEMAVS